MAPITSTYSHRPTTKTLNKSFKTRHASKSALKDRAKGKTESFERGSRKTPHQQVMSKFDRRNQARQLRVNKLTQREKDASVFGGRDGAPRIVAVVPLCEDVMGDVVVSSLNTSVDVENNKLAAANNGGQQRVEVPRFKQRMQYLTPERDLLQCMDACRVADFVVLLLSATDEVDELGEHILRCIESQGISTVLTGVHNLDEVEPAKKRPDVLKSLKSYITHFFPTQEKVHDLGSRQDCSNVMRSLCTTMPKGIRWRDDRSWLVAEDVRLENGDAVVTGVVRGRGLNVDRLVQLGDLGDFQIGKFTAAPLEIRRKVQKADAMAVDIPEDGDVLDRPTEDRDDLAELAPEITMDDVTAESLAPSDRKAVLLDEHHYFDEGEQEELKAPMRLPRGTSKYQAAWYLGDDSDSGSDLEDMEPDQDGDIDLDGQGVEDGIFDEAMAEPTEAEAPSEYPQSEVFNDRALDDEAEELEAYRKQRKDEAKEDLEFPDEIELHPRVLARERLARYRGLKSIRTSTWDTEADKMYEPEDWSRLLEIADYKSAKNRVLKELFNVGVKPGTRVHVHLRLTPNQEVALRFLPKPTALFSLLRHEHKRTAVNTSLSLSSDYENPLKSKEEIILQCGPRRLVINPLFSQAGNTSNDVHKFNRYLHPGRTAVASFIGPVLWGSVPCLYFKHSTPQPQDPSSDFVRSPNSSRSPTLELIGTGTTLPPSTHRVVAKRIILTGHPYKIHRKLVTVRYMFFNTEDVEYFRALPLWTRRGRSGYVREPLGTHGYFKATFDGKVNALDAVAVSLFKRVWPRAARTWKNGEEGERDVQGMSRDGNGGRMME